MPAESLVALGEALENRFCTEVLIEPECERRAVLRMIKEDVGGQTMFRQGVLNADKVSAGMLYDDG